MNYSSDQDMVPVYYADAAGLPDSLEPLHEAAKVQIDRDLKAAGWETGDLAALTEATLEALKVPSCCYVMSLMFRQAAAHDRGLESIDKAKFWRGEYQAALAATVIETTLAEADDPAPTRSGYVVLG